MFSLINDPTLLPLAVGASSVDDGIANAAAAGVLVGVAVGLANGFSDGSIRTCTGGSGGTSFRTAIWPKMARATRTGIDKIATTFEILFLIAPWRSAPNTVTAAVAKIPITR
jgi:hypothetical protein